jgi:hypothetical protein
MSASTKNGSLNWSCTQMPSRRSRARLVNPSRALTASNS